MTAEERRKLSRRGQDCLVDDEDFDSLSQWRWSVHTMGYAVRTQHIKEKTRRIFMHRFIIGVRPIWSVGRRL